MVATLSPITVPEGARDPGAERIRAVIVAHHALVGEAVRMALTSRGIVSLTLPGGHGRRQFSELARIVDSSRPDAGLILCDIDDPGQLRDTMRIVGRVPIRWLLLTNSADESRWGAVVEAGVRGILPMSEGLEVVDGTLRQVASGRPGLSDGMRERVIAAWWRAGAEHRRLVAQMGELTPREMAVLGMLAGGLTVKQIARRSQVAEGTVRSQVRSLLRKLEVNSQLAAVAAHRHVVGQSPPFPRGHA